MSYLIKLQPYRGKAKYVQTESVLKWAMENTDAYIMWWRENPYKEEADSPFLNQEKYEEFQEVLKITGKVAEYVDEFGHSSYFPSDCVPPVMEWYFEQATHDYKSADVYKLTTDLTFEE